MAVVDDRRLMAGPEQIAEAEEVVAWLRPMRPRLVGVDGPRRAAPDGCLSRRDERELRASVCGIRYTPDAASLAKNRRYYEWIFRGFELYEALAEAGIDAVECFPTASWTRWIGPRGDVPRGAWSARALVRLGLSELPAGLGQDGRDAIGAALTARVCDAGDVERFGEIVVPRQGLGGYCGHTRSRSRANLDRRGG